MMTVKLNINKTAYVPGEPLVYEIYVDNRSDNNVKDMDLILRQVRYSFLNIFLFQHTAVCLCTNIQQQK